MFFVGILLLALVIAFFVYDAYYWRTRATPFLERALAILILVLLVTMSLGIMMFSHNPRMLYVLYILLMPALLIGALGLFLIRQRFVRREIQRLRQQRQKMMEDIMDLLRKDNEPN